MNSRHGSRTQADPLVAHALGELFPDGTQERLLKVSTSLRFSAPLLRRVDEIAEAKSITRTEAIERILSWALDTLEPDREALAKVIQDRRRRPSGSSRRGKGVASTNKKPRQGTDGT